MSTFCRHVYEEVKNDPCEDCGMPSHKIDWKLQADSHKEWIASGKATAQGVWWSI